MNLLVDRISKNTLETAYLSIFVNDSVVLTALAEGTQAVRASGLDVGMSGLEHVRASGRAILAFLDEDERELLLQKALGDQEYEIGICGIAAPFFSESGTVLGAVGIWAPATRFYDLRESLISHML